MLIKEGKLFNNPKKTAKEDEAQKMMRLEKVSFVAILKWHDFDVRTCAIARNRGDGEVGRNSVGKDSSRHPRAFLSCLF